LDSNKENSKAQVVFAVEEVKEEGPIRKITSTMTPTTTPKKSDSIHDHSFIHRRTAMPASMTSNLQDTFQLLVSPSDANLHIDVDDLMCTNSI
jgi:hypothetical protein